MQEMSQSRLGLSVESIAEREDRRSVQDFVQMPMLTMHSVPSDVDSADRKTLEDKLRRGTKFFKSDKHVIEDDDSLPKNLNTLNIMFKGQ